MDDPRPPLPPLPPYDAGPTQATVNALLDSVTPETEPRAHLTVGGLRGKVALITGGSSGIGRAVGVALARSGVHIAFSYLDESPEAQQEADRTAAELTACGVRVVHRAMDVASSAAVDGFVQEVRERLGGLFILVNNAGIGRDGALWRLSTSDWNRVLETNLSAAFYHIRAVAPLFRAQEAGRIVNVASIHARRAEFGLVNYAASKAGVEALTRNAALELGPSNINVNAVAPGYIRTTRLTDRVPTEILDEARERSALRRLGDPQDVAGAVLFLCSEAARHLTGVTLPVDGGYLL
jgi:3-oxoacyl-[acyl-carrier protein] reductase